MVRFGYYEVVILAGNAVANGSSDIDEKKAEESNRDAFNEHCFLSLDGCAWSTEWSGSGDCFSRESRPSCILELDCMNDHLNVEGKCTPK